MKKALHTKTRKVAKTVKQPLYGFLDMSRDDWRFMEEKDREFERDLLDEISKNGVVRVNY